MRRLHGYATLMASAIMLGLFSFSAMAQAPADNAGNDGVGNYEAGFTIGSLLPNRIGGVTEIMGLGGLKAGARISPDSWLDATLIMGNGSGQSWLDGAVDARMDIPVENLVAIAFIGLDVLQYEGPGQGSTFDFGGHVGGGVQANLGKNFLIRTEMKFQFNPGTSLLIDLSFLWRFGEGGAGGGS